MTTVGVLVFGVATASGVAEPVSNFRTDDECKVAWRLRLLLSPVQTLPTRCVCNQPNPLAKDPEHSFKCAALRKISAFRRHQMVVWFMQSFVHRHGGTVVLGPTHIGGDPSKRQVDLRIRIGDLSVDGDEHIHNPTSGNNTSKTPFAVTKRAARRAATRAATRTRMTSSASWTSAPKARRRNS
jgi:hypothetical protein